jgi:hypothetical protein
LQICYNCYLERSVVKSHIAAFLGKVVTGEGESSSLHEIAAEYLNHAPKQYEGIFKKFFR